MENFVAGTFQTQEQAETAQNSLAQLAAGKAVVLYQAQLYARGEDGDLVRLSAGVDNSRLFDPASWPVETEQEAIDELNERLPDNEVALLMRVNETDPSLIDAAIRSAGGEVFRLSIAQAQDAEQDRILDE